MSIKKKVRPSPVSMVAYGEPFLASSSCMASFDDYFSFFLKNIFKDDLLITLPVPIETDFQGFSLCERFIKPIAEYILYIR